MPPIGQTAVDAGRIRSLIGLPGDWGAHGDFDKIITLWNASPQAKKVVTTTITDPGDSLTMTITIENVVMAVGTGVGLDATGIAAAMALAINQEPRIRANVIASSAGAVLTLTAVNEGYDFQVSEADANLSTPTVVTAAAGAAAVPCGRAMISRDRNGTWTSERLGALAASALLTAQVQTFSFGAMVASEVLIANVYAVRGTEREFIASARVVEATSLDATLDALATALGTALTGLPVTVASAPATATTLVFTASVAGFEFDVDVISSGGGAGPHTITKANTTGPNPATSIHRALAGVSLRPQDEMATSTLATDVEWPGGRGVRAGIQGEVIVACAEAVIEGSPVFVELGVPADNGKFFLAGSATRVQLPRALAFWTRRGYPAGDGVGAVRINIPG
jgi:hypothetical protein